MGAGAWGTTFAQVLSDAGTPVTLWSRRSELAAEISTRHESTRYLPGIALPASLHATADPAEALAGAEIVVLAVPAQSLRQNLTDWRELLSPGALLVSLMKGIELGTGHRRDHRGRPGPDRCCLRAQPRAGDRDAAVLRHRGGLCR
jgi:glycerol-3-phosphate dehydrogenase (NAD(P)+)